MADLSRHLLRLALALLVALTACSSGPEGRDVNPATGRTESEEILCAKWWVIANDAADGVDTVSETRDRLRDLYEEFRYDEDVNEGMRWDLEQVIAALTAALQGGGTDEVETAVRRMDSACA